jgi:hypothetical protein
LRIALAGALLFALVALPVRQARAQVLDPNFPNTNGSVNASALVGNTLYIGGQFSYVGPYLGSFIALDATTAAVIPAWPRVEGTVYASAADGSGGFYIGGLFNKVGGVAHDCLAHIHADGSVDPWDPGVVGVPRLISAIVVDGGTVYVGGWFSSIGGQARNNLAAIDATTGAVTAWNPGTDSNVHALALSGTTLYVGGEFYQLGGQSRQAIGAVSTVSGAPTNWNPGCDGIVYALALDGATVYAGGYYSNAGGQPRSGMAAFNNTDGSATGWDPQVQGGSVGAIVVNGGLVYVAGGFYSAGGEFRNNLAAIDKSSALATSWDPNVYGYGFPVQSMALSNGIIYVGREIHAVGNQQRTNAAAIDASSGAPRAGAAMNGPVATIG